MKRFTFFSSFLLMVVLLNVSIYAQPCEVSTTNVTFESANSLTFDVYIKNTGTSSWTYSHGSYAWTYNSALLNGGTPTFSLVTGFSDFPSGAQPPSALLSSPSILRTSSNLPGSNGVILAGQNLRLYRFRLQTSAAAFAGTTFDAAWKTASTPYSRVFMWNSTTGLPEENLSLSFIIDGESLVLDENFDYGAVANPDLIVVTSNWVRHSGVAGPAYITTSLSYPSYLSSGIGGSVTFTNGGSGVNDGDVNRSLAAPVNTDNNIYSACLLNLTSALSGDYFFHVGPGPIGTTFRGRVFAKANGAGWSLGLSKSTEARTDDNTILNFNQTYLVVLKYTLSTVGTTDDVVTLYLYESGYPASEPGSPLITIGPIGAGLAGDLTNLGTIAIRQGTNTPTGTVDGIRMGTSWAEIFPSVGTPLLSASPSALSGFNYLIGSGPSASQPYNLSGSDLSPLSGNITVTAPTNYEVSLNNTSFTTDVNVPYVGGVFANIPVYVRLKAGLIAGNYNEAVTNAGGGATNLNVNCTGSVTGFEPTNHATFFNGALGIPSYATINLNWVDATGSIIPDGYLIRASSRAFDSIAVPIDGTPVANGTFAQNVAAGVQTVKFTTLLGGRTYYYKIFPYTNSGSLINYKTDGVVPQFSITTDTPPVLPIVETLNYTTGTLLTDNGWLAHNAGGTNSLTVSGAALSYPGYLLSGTGKSVTMTTSGEDANRAFDSVKTGSIYGSFLVNVSSAQTGDYFFHFGLENNTSLFFGRVFIKDSLGSLGFGVAKTLTAAVVYTPCIYSPGTTYLIVVKYTFNTGTIKDDEAKLWVNPVLDGIEPQPNVTATDTLPDALALGMFALRQGGSGSSAALTVGGIRVANSWVPAAGSGVTLNLTAYVEGFWNGTTMVSDNVTVELRDASSPYSVVDQQTINLNTSGTGSGMFYNAVNGIPYYIVLKHRNSVETWSAAPQQFTSGSLTYNFSTAAAQAYGNNMVLKNTKWCLYSGDVNQDGMVDLQDMRTVDNTLGSAGSLLGDVNGDGTVSSLDMNIVNTNSMNYIGLKSPASPPQEDANVKLNPED